MQLTLKVAKGLNSLYIIRSDAWSDQTQISRQS